MTTTKLAVFLSGVFLLLPLLASGRGHPNGGVGAADGGQVTLGDCTIQVPPGAKQQPQQSWYDTFKQTFEPARQQWEASIDKSQWQAREQQEFNSCAAFKILIGICWKESNLNPSVGNGADAIPSPGLCQIQARNCEKFRITEAQLHQAEKNIECAGKIMADILQRDRCITQGADQAGNGRCFTNWSVMIDETKNKVGHRQKIREYVTGSSGGR